MDEEAKLAGYVSQITVHKIRSVGRDEAESTEPGKDLLLEKVKEAGQHDREYQALLAYLRSSDGTIPPEATPYKGIRDELSEDNGLVLYGCRVVIPTSMRKEILKRLHESTPRDDKDQDASKAGCLLARSQCGHNVHNRGMPPPARPICQASRKSRSRRTRCPANALRR